jgi:ADP-ribose pyrophosphatase YjhB (NUDIX family)
MNVVITCRAIVIHDGKLLMCKHNEPGRSFFNLPGGKLESSETIEQCLEREMVEETGIKPVIGKLLIINQFINANHHKIEFFFQVKNSSNYTTFDPSKASHNFEVSDFTFDSPLKPKYDIKPKFLVDRFEELVAKGNDFDTELMISS